MSQKTWTRGDVIALLSFLVALVALISTVVVSEIRQFIGLDPRPDGHKPPTSSMTTSPKPPTPFSTPQVTSNSSALPRPAMSTREGVDVETMRLRRIITMRNIKFDRLRRIIDEINQLESSSLGGTPEGQEALQRLKAEKRRIIDEINQEKVNR